MRRTSLFLLLLVSVSPLSFGQYRGAQIRGGQFRGGASPLRPPQIGALGRPIPRAPGSGFGRRGGYGRGYRGGFGIASYPVFISGFGGDYYPGYGDYPMGGGGGDYAPVASAAPPPPPVIINQYFGDPSQGGQAETEDPSVRVYSQPERPAGAAIASAEPRSYLIALKDHSVFSALAYWVEDHTLHYVTPQNTHNQTDLSQVDVEFTKKLNQDRDMTAIGTP